MINKTATSANTAYTAHSVRPNFGFAETSYLLGTLYAMPCLKNENKRR